MPKEELMRIKSFSITLLTILVIIFTTIGCNKSAYISPQVLNQIKLELIGTSEQPLGIAYSFKLKNLSEHTIKQNNIYLSYPIKTTNGSKGNDFKVEAKNNKLDIKPNEEVIITVFTPKEEYEGNEKLDIKHFNIELVGYIDEIKEKNRFQKYGGIDYFK
jgi:hypothetical protein